MSKSDPALPEQDNPPEQAGKHAVAAHIHNSLGTAFAYKCLRIIHWGTGGNTIQAVIIGVLLYFVLHPPVKYFATENGRITQVYATDAPIWNESDVSQFGADTIRYAFTLDFVHYKNEMTAVAPRFDHLGFDGYISALQSSNILSAVRDKRMNLSVSVDPGVITKRGVINGRNAWEFQYPVTYRLQGQNSDGPPSHYILTLRIQQADVREKPLGLEVTQIISTNAG